MSIKSKAALLAGMAMLGATALSAPPTEYKRGNAPQTELTKKQKKRRAKNKVAKHSRKRNRK